MPTASRSGEGHNELRINKIIETSEQAPRADKSAVGAINRPLRLPGFIFKRAISKAPFNKDGDETGHAVYTQLNRNGSVF
jgi:hypothetical protein